MGLVVQVPWFPGWSVAALLGLLLGLLLALGWIGRWFWLKRDLLVTWTRSAGKRIASLPVARRLTARHPRLWAFVARRFSPGEYLGLHLTVGLVISLAALVAFGTLVEDLLNQEEIARLDLPIANFLHAHATASGVNAFSLITEFGSVATLSALGVAVAAVLLARQRWILLLGWLAAVAGGGLLVTALKMVLRRPRPSFANPFVYEPSWSFPSGHAMASVIAYGMLAYLGVLPLERRWSRILIVLAGTLLVLAIGFSRLYLGAHYLTDVLAGYAVGLVWLTACVTGVEVVRQRAMHDKRNQRKGQR